MRDFKAALAVLLFFPLWMALSLEKAKAQSDDRIRSVLSLTGASSEEELDEQEVERFQHFQSNPLAINLASRSKLLSSGLLSQYQVASLTDYRSRYGDVLSFTELAAVEGFGTEYVAALKPFVSLESRSLPGEPANDTLRLRQDALVRAAVKGESFNHGMKYKISMGERAEASLAARSYYQDKSQFPPSSLSFNVVCYGKHKLGKAVLGDYNLRLGQGLSLWSGLSLGGFSSSSSFSRRPTLLSPSSSWSGTGSHRGAAADFQFGRFSVVSFLSFPGLRERMQGSTKKPVELMGGGTIGWFGKSGQVSVSAWAREEVSGGPPKGGKLSLDSRWNFFGADLFGEAAYDIVSSSLAGVLGTSVSLGEGWRLNVVAREYPSLFDGEFSGGVRSWTKTSDERGVALGVERYGAQITADLASKVSAKSKRQCKLFLKVPFQLSETAILSLRMTGRIRPYEEYLKYRTDARLDLDWSSAGLSARYGESDGDTWKGRFRIDGILCRSLSGLTYLEGGRKTEKWNAYLRGTLFIVDNWDDRIYSYERDAPGNFTVPAYYGRGYSVSAVGGRKFRAGKKNTLKLYFRASTVRYPFMKTPKPSSFEVKAQAVAAF